MLSVCYFINSFCSLNKLQIPLLQHTQYGRAKIYLGNYRYLDCFQIFIIKSKHLIKIFVLLSLALVK